MYSYKYMYLYTNKDIRNLAFMQSEYLNTASVNLVIIFCIYLATIILENPKAQ